MGDLLRRPGCKPYQGDAVALFLNRAYMLGIHPDQPAHIELKRYEP